MGANRASEEVPVRPSSTEDTPGRSEEGGGLRTASWIIAAVSTSALVGGGIGMLAGVALGAINPAGLGIIGVVVGTFASVPLTRAALKW